MKSNILNILFAAAVCSMTLSCAKQESLSPDERQQTKLSFTCCNETISPVQTKSYINDWTAGSQNWAADDRISILSDGANTPLSNTISDGATAKFEGEVPSASSYLALYPYQEEAFSLKGKITATLPSEQVADVHGTDPRALLAVASADGSGGTLAFRNVFSIVRFTVTDTDVTAIILEGNNGETIAGKVSITPGTDPSWTAVEGEKTITLTTSDGSAFKAGNYAAAVLPQTFSKGLRLILKKSGSVKCSVRSVSAELQMARSGGIGVPSSLFSTPDYKFYYIMNKADLDAFFEDKASWTDTDIAYLGADIDYGKAKRGHNSGVFRGLFDGRYHRIYNLFGNGENCKAGFFAQVIGTVKNLCLGSADYDWSKGSAADAGTYDGYSHYKITGCASGSNSWYYAGSVAGYLGDSGGEIPCTLENIVNFCEVRMVPASFGAKKYGFRLGGISGTMKGSCTIKNCINFGSVMTNNLVGSSYSSPLQVAGIVSTNDGEGCTITGCVNRGSVVNSNSVYGVTGGIIGGLPKAISISDCTNYGKVEDDSDPSISKYIGGIVGNVTAESNTILGCKTYAEVSTGGIRTDKTARAVVGAFSGAGTLEITNCHIEGSVDGVMMSENNIQSYACANTGTGQLKLSGCTSVPAVVSEDFEGAGTEENPYKINTAEDFVKMATLINGSTTNKQYKSCHYAMQNDIDFASVDNFTPIGITSTLNFYGTIDGQGYRILNFTCDGSAYNVAGLVGCGGTGSMVKNITFVNPTVSCTYQAGTAVGFLYRGAVSNIKVEGGSVRSTTNITVSTLGVSCTGGIAGRAYQASIDNCSFQGTVAAIGNQSAGICGWCDGTSVKKCSVGQGSSIASGYYTGGIVAKLLSTDASKLNYAIEDCVFEGTVTCKNWGCGGIVANMNGGVVRNCVAASHATVKANAYYAGGIVGIINTTTDGQGKVATIDKCVSYADIQSGYDVGGILGYSTFPAGYTVNVTNCATLGGEIIATSNNGGSNLYALVAGIAGYVTGAGSTNICNCYAAPERIDALSDGKGGIAGLLGYNSPTTGLVQNCFTPLTAADFSFHSQSITAAGLTYFGAVVGRSNAAGAAYKDIFYNESMPAGQFDKGNRESSVKGISVTAMTDGTLLGSLNSVVTAGLPSIEGVTYNSWVAGADSMPVLSGLSADPHPSTKATRRVSIIGDSISTFAGYGLPSYSIHYPNAKCDVLDVSQTWWHQVIYKKMTGAKLDMNISFGNTTVTRNLKGDSSAYWYGYDFCSRFVTCAGVGRPDVIFIHGGTNDRAHATGEELYPGIAMSSTEAPSEAQMNAIFAVADAATTNSAAEALGFDTFAESYLKLVRMCTVRYPSAKIVCLVGDGLAPGMGEVVKMIADHYPNARYVDFLGTFGFRENTYVTKYDGTTHPDANGMTHMADYIWETVGDWLK